MIAGSLALPLRVTYQFEPRHNDVCRDANVPTLGFRGQGSIGCFRCARFSFGGSISTSCASKGDGANI